MKIENPLLNFQPNEKCNRNENINYLKCIRCQTFLVILFIIVYLFFLMGYQEENFKQLTYTNTSKEIVKYLVNGPQCKIADLDPFAPEVMKLFVREKEEVCTEMKPLTTVFRNPQTGTVHLLIDESFSEYFDLDKNNIVCCYQNISRAVDPNRSDDNDEFSNCTYFRHSIVIPRSSEFIYVHCKNDTEEKEIPYKNIHVIVPEDPSVKERIEKFNVTSQKRPISVLMIGVDSISRLNLIRAMSETTKYLSDKNWFELQGYNKIDDNTFPNLMAVLTGFDQETAYSVCDPKTLYGLDNCPLIWNTFTENGYVTGYAEDESNLGTFNYLKKGFVKQPTDYYLRPAMKASENLLKIKWKNGMKFCEGFQYAADYVYNYGIDFAEMYQERPFFGLFWTNSFSHNDVNDPSSMDRVMVSKLKDIERKGILEDSIVVFFSDHGMRFGPIRKLMTGWAEERLPFLYFSLPQWFQREYPEIVTNLRINKNRLTNPYDLHMTLKHILRLSDRAPLNLTDALSCPKCQSMFEEVPLNRSCEDVAIPNHWCTCNAYMPINMSAIVVKEAATYAVGFINTEIKELLKGNQNSTGRDLCAKLELKKISLAGKGPEQNGYSDILIQFEVSPGGGEFEATVRSFSTGNYSISTSMSRLNSYEKTSQCVDDKLLKLYCHCI